METNCVTRTQLEILASGKILVSKGTVVLRRWERKIFHGGNSTFISSFDKIFLVFVNWISIWNFRLSYELGKYSTYMISSTYYRHNLTIRWIIGEPQNSKPLTYAGCYCIKFRHRRRSEIMPDREERKHGGLKYKTKRIISYAMFWETL